MYLHFRVGVPDPNKNVTDPVDFFFYKLDVTIRLRILHTARTSDKLFRKIMYLGVLSFHSSLRVDLWVWILIKFFYNEESKFKCKHLFVVFLVSKLASNVVNSELFCLHQDSTFQVIPDPDPSKTFKAFLI
jgi:hypothetical protein